MTFLPRCGDDRRIRRPRQRELKEPELPQASARDLSGPRALLSEQDGKKKQATFVYQYYVPYFVEMKQKGHVEAFVYNALQSSGLPGVREWLGANSGHVMQFLLWSKNYQWPSSVKM